MKPCPELVEGNLLLADTILVPIPDAEPHAPPTRS